MSFENERRRRIQAIMEILEKAGKEGVVPQLLYKRVAPEITKERLFKSIAKRHPPISKLVQWVVDIYLDELAWAGIIAKLPNGKIRLLK